MAIFRRSRPVILGNPIFVIFRGGGGGGGPSVPPSGSAHEQIERDFCSNARFVLLIFKL